MNVTEFIGRHMNCELPVVEYAGVCKMCGCQINAGVHISNAINKSTFMDFQYFRHVSDYLCVNCVSVMGKINGTYLRNYSFICTDAELRILKRENILELILNPPAPPFVFTVSYSNKKHIAFKAGIQQCRDIFIVSTDIGDVQIDRQKAISIVNIIQCWYSIIPEKTQTKQQPTWFTKDDILHGCKNTKRIIDYGIEKYFTENQQIEQWRGTSLLKLLVFALNKK